jgi:hypothetical protein
MANLPTELVTKDRDRWRDDYLKWYRLRNPLAKVGPGEMAYIDASCLADQLVVQSANALILAGRTSLANRTGDQLDEYGAVVGRTRAAATGASGYVVVSCGTSGTTIVEGDELTSTTKQTVYAAKRTKACVDGDTIDVECTETGPGTNLDPGEELTWSAPRPGCYADAVVYELPNGNGLTGGREVEGDDDYRDALQIVTSNPAAAGNDAEVQRLAEDADGTYVRARYGSTQGGHGVSVEKAFTYPALLGPGSIGLAFVMKPQTATGSRIPSAEQMTDVYQHVTQWLPHDDGVIEIAIVEEDLDVAFRVKWASDGWEDSVPWPPYVAEASHYCVTARTSATSMTIGTADGVYTGRTAPQVGDIFAVFDSEFGLFRRKAVGAVSGSGPWLVTCDTAAEASDVSFTPPVGARVSPWAGALAGLAEIMVAHVASMGPGEASAYDPGDGRRMLRSPGAGAGLWPSVMTSRPLADIAELPTVSRVEFILGDDAEVTVGDAAAVNIFTLADIGVHPL